MPTSWQLTKLAAESVDKTDDDLTFLRNILTNEMAKRKVQSILKKTTPTKKEFYSYAPIYHIHVQKLAPSRFSHKHDTDRGRICQTNLGRRGKYFPETLSKTTQDCNDLRTTDQQLYILIMMKYQFLTGIWNNDVR